MIPLQLSNSKRMQIDYVLCYYLLCIHLHRHTDTRTSTRSHLPVPPTHPHPI